jgi:hypothetical protein
VTREEEIKQEVLGRTNGPYRKRRLQQFYFCVYLLPQNVSTEPLLSSDTLGYTQIYEKDLIKCAVEVS